MDIRIQCKLPLSTISARIVHQQANLPLTLLTSHLCCIDCKMLNVYIPHFTPILFDSYLAPPYLTSATTLCPHGNHLILSLPSFSIKALLSSVLVDGPDPNLCHPPCSTSAQLRSLFLFKSSLFLLLSHPLSLVQWPLSKCVFVSLSEAQCVSAR